MPKDLKRIAIPAVESGGGAEPQKPFLILEYGCYFVVGQSLGDIQVGEPVFIVLGQDGCAHQGGQETYGKNAPHTGQSLQIMKNFP